MILKIEEPIPEGIEVEARVRLAEAFANRDLDAVRDTLTEDCVICSNGEEALQGNEEVSYCLADLVDELDGDDVEMVLRWEPSYWGWCISFRTAQDYLIAILSFETVGSKIKRINVVGELEFNFENEVLVEANSLFEFDDQSLPGGQVEADSLFPLTLATVEDMLEGMRREAEAFRWKDVSPEDFYIKNDGEGVQLCLDYVAEGRYEMQFRIGVKKNGFAAPNPNYFIDITYEFSSLSEDEAERKYYEKENLEFCRYADVLLDIPFRWQAILAHSEGSVFISTKREVAYQKFCLFLDIIIPLKNHYKASETQGDEGNREEPDYIFTSGRYKRDGMVNP